MSKTINEEQCREVELNYKKRLMDSFGKLNGRKTIGSCTFLYKKYGCPKTYQDFYNKYTSDTENCDPKYRGRTEQELNALAERFKALVGDNTIPLHVFYDYLVKKIIIDTLDGHKKELALYSILNEKGYTIKEPTIEEDSNYGIDGFAYKGNSLKFIMQIKPLSFFYGNRNYYLLQDRKLALEKAQMCNEKYDIPVFYFIYNGKEQTWCKNGNSLMFNITDLLNEDGTTNIRNFNL